MERNFNSKRENHKKKRYGSDLMMQREKKNIRIELNSNKRYTYIYIYIYIAFFFMSIYYLVSLPLIRKNSTEN